MTEERYSMWDLEQSLRAEIRERADELRDETYPEDIVTEMADGWVPVYTYDLLQYAANDLDLAVDEPDLGPAFDGAPTPVNIIAANIYERLQAAGFDELQALQDEWENEDA